MRTPTVTETHRHAELPLQATVEGRTVEVSRHAVEQYGERVRPGLDRLAVGVEVCAVLEAGGRLAGKPEWGGVHERQEAPEWVLVGNDVAFPLLNNVLTTCLVRGSLPDLTRAARNQRRAAARARRRSKVLVQRSTRRSDEPWRPDAA